MDMLTPFLIICASLGVSESQVPTTSGFEQITVDYSQTGSYQTTYAIMTDMFTSATDSSDPTSSGKIPIYLGGFLSIGGGTWDGSGMLPAIELALEHINDRPDVLARYELRMVWNDSECDAGLGTRFLFEQLYHGPQKVMIIGPACSPDAQAVAQTSSYWNLITLSYSAASSALSNRDTYPLFFRTYLPDAQYNPVRIMLLQAFEWTRVATIHTNEELFSLAIDNLWTLLKQARIEIVASESFTGSPTNQMEKIQSVDARIIIANMYERDAMKVFCEAYRLGMYGENYVWILIGWYGRHWWREDKFRGQNMTCTSEEVQEVVLTSMYISTEVENFDTSGKETVAGYTSSEIMDMYEDRLKWPEYQHTKASGLDYFSYDAAWGIALALNHSSAIMDSEGLANGPRRNLEDFNYDDEDMKDIFFSELQKLRFHGATGLVSFSEADRVGPIRVEQLQGSCSGDWHLLGMHCYRFVDNEGLSWSDARSACGRYTTGNLRESILAPITSKKEFEFLVTIWKNSDMHASTWHIGLHQDGTQLRWADSTKGVLTVFPDVPSFEGPVDLNRCFSIDFRNGGSWIATSCVDEAKPYVCRRIADFEERYITRVIPFDTREPDFSALRWPGGVVPLDRSPGYTFVDVHDGISLILYASIGSVTVVCVLMALLFLGFNIHFAEQRFVKLSSPKLNNLIIIGSLLIYSSILAAGLEIRDITRVFPSVCMMRTWMVSVGFVLSFGAMFSKTWRVHRVATFKTPKRRIVTDGQLFGIVGFLLLVDISILTSWQILDPQQLETKNLTVKDDPDIEMQILRPYINICTSDQMYIWSSVLYGYKGLLLIFGTFLAWETRKVTIPALNDSKLIGLSVYNVIILCAIGLGVSFALEDDPEALFLFISSLMLFCTTATLIVVFVPKIISVYKDPEGENALSRNNNTTHSETIRSPPSQSTLAEVPVESNRALVEENKSLKEEVLQLKKALSVSASNGGTPVGSDKEPSTQSETLPPEGGGIWMGFPRPSGEKYQVDGGNRTD